MRARLALALLGDDPEWLDLHRWPGAGPRPVAADLTNDSLWNWRRQVITAARHAPAASRDCCGDHRRAAAQGQRLRRAWGYQRSARQPLSCAARPGPQVGAGRPSNSPQETRPAKADTPAANVLCLDAPLEDSRRPARYELFDQIWLSPSLASKQSDAQIERRNVTAETAASTTPLANGRAQVVTVRDRSTSTIGRGAPDAQTRQREPCPHARRRAQQTGWRGLVLHLPRCGSWP